MIEIYLIVCGVLTGLLFLNRNNILNYILLFFFLLIQWALTVYAYQNINLTELNYFKIDALGFLLLTTLSIISIPALYHSYRFVVTQKNSARHISIYFSAMVMLLSCISAAYLSNHIAVTWIFVELTTLSASVLIHHRRNSRSLEGTWKYVFVCAISITLVFIGILFLSFALKQAGSVDLSYDSLLSKAKILNPFWLKLAFLFIFTGFTAKLGLFPMYTAGIDAKDKAPSPAGAVFSSVLMNMGFIGIFRMYIIMANSSLHSWTNGVIFVAAFLSIFVAAVYMVKVTNIKRMLAYSGVEHMGLVMLGVAAGGVGYYAAILHVILHAFVKSSIFFQIGQVYRIYQSKSIFDVGNYFKYNLTGAVVMILCFFSTTAMPPFGLFVSEFMIFRSLLEMHHVALLIGVLLLLTMIIWALGKSIFKLVFLPLPEFDEKNIEIISPVESLSQLVLLALALYIGLNPPVQFTLLIQEAIINLPH